MSNSNKHIEEFLDYYLEHETSPDYAVLITGCWGSGKTYFIRQFLEKNGAAGKNVVKTFDWLTGFEKYTVVYVSLFGLKTRDDINKKIEQIFRPKINSKKMGYLPDAISLVSNLACIAVGAATTIATGGSAVPSAVPVGVATGKSVGDALKFFSSNFLKDIKVNKKEYKRLVVVFDDVERADMPLPELLGYLNEYVEHLHIHCILLADKEKWEEAQKCQKDKSTLHHLSSTKEKVIGKEFQIQTSFDEVWNFWDRKENHPVGDRAWDIVGKYYDLIKDILRTSEINNYRALRNTLSDFQRFIGDNAKDIKMGKIFIDDKYFEHKEFAELIIADFICYQYAFHVGLLNPEEITDHNLYKSVQYAKTEASREVKLVVEKIDDQNHLAGKLISETVEQRNTYSLFEERFKEIPRISTQPYDIMSFDPKYNSKWSDIWKKWLTGFYVDSEEVQKLMDKSIWYDEKDNFAINQIIKYHSLDDATAKKLLSEIEQNINDRKYTNPNYVFILFNSWLLLVSQGIFDYGVDECYKRIKDYIDTVIFDNVPLGGREGTLASDDEKVQKMQEQLWNLINEKRPHENLTMDQRYIKYFWNKIGASAFSEVFKTIAERKEFPLVKLDVKKILNLYKSEIFKTNRLNFNHSIANRLEMLYKFAENEQLKTEIEYLKKYDSEIEKMLKKEPKPLLPNALSLNLLKGLGQSASDSYEMKRKTR